jgi:hypothetical protein
VKIVDDNALARRSLALTLADVNWEPIDEPGPLLSLDDFVSSSIASVDAVICDHRLTTYARFSGAEAVAKFYIEKFPAILCTAWSRADIDAMRPYRRFIPVVLGTNNANPETIIESFRICKRELTGEFSTIRKPWRTLIRVAEVDEETNIVFVVIPAWNSAEIIRLTKELFPNQIQSKLRPDFRFHSQVNLGSEDQNDLYFDLFETD